MKESMSVADSLYNLQFIHEFCDSCLKSCCQLALEDMLYTPQELQVLTFTFLINHLNDILTKILSTVFLIPDLFCVMGLAQPAELPVRTALLV